MDCTRWSLFHTMNRGPLLSAVKPYMLLRLYRITHSHDFVIPYSWRKTKMEICLLETMSHLIVFPSIGSVCEARLQSYCLSFAHLSLIVYGQHVSKQHLYPTFVASISEIFPTFQGDLLYVGTNLSYNCPKTMSYMIIAFPSYILAKS